MPLPHVIQSSKVFNGLAKPFRRSCGGWKGNVLPVNNKNSITMKKMYRQKRIAALLVGVTLTAASCATISRFDQYAYAQTTSLKVDALSLMGSATDSFPVHAAEAAQVQTTLNKLVEYEKNRPKNAITEKMWSLMSDSTGHLYAGFMSRWEKEGRLDTAFIRISKDLVGQSFDQISQLESGKIRSANN
jgi:hypothetical protein